MIHVLVVDDSKVSRDLLSGILESEPDISVIGTASDGNEAVRLANILSPDIITMDINMPGMDGFEAARRIMEESPIPIIIISGVDNLAEIAASFRVMEAGALAILPKPPHPTSPDFPVKSLEIINAIRTYVEIKVIKRVRTHSPKNETLKHTTIPKGVHPRVIVIGASTGGPPVIQTILRILDPKFPLPLVLVQHMSPGFIMGFAEWLSESTGFNVKIPGLNEKLLPGVLYVAPDGVQTGVSGDLRIILSDAPSEHNLRPSVSYLFRSAAGNLGASAVGVLLTGMGTDGSQELLNMRKKGSITLIQDRASSIVYGMPGEAMRIGAASLILSPEDIAQQLQVLAG
ncbi:MAG TPA: chemotaxis-specific protein-glutamate methyltransferase CheB [Methanospirillum sp.]|uniref:chemotaxis-specific protein-glutamate methyltransferase CheB n=1 Tax=Methanospirillum sp. TaxID=45200 RepID=UPI002D12D9AB|nr:chemotaxis-specific protein-glutamate methyltransferase CheB [Methanospirillum sp.]HWQ64920.1 chemotaxis-specific protein-glutamate methyltransferase CheB [Methanospirillum sp.]